MNTDLNYLHLYYFWIASLERGFLKASKKLGISQSTVSIQIQNLEKQLGHQLLKRGPRQFELTEEGKLAFESCQSIFQQGETLLRSMKNPGVKSQVLRIGLDDRLGFKVRMDFLQSLMDKEGLTFKVEHGQAENLVSKISGRQLDVVCSNQRPSPTPDRVVRFRPVASSSFALVGKKKWRRKKEKGALSLDGVPLFLPPIGEPGRNIFDSWNKSRHVEIRGESPNWDMLSEFALRGWGLALLPKKLILEDLQKDRLCLMHEFRGASEDYYLAYHADQEKNAAFQSDLKVMIKSI